MEDQDDSHVSLDNDDGIFNSVALNIDLDSNPVNSDEVEVDVMNVELEEPNPNQKKKKTYTCLICSRKFTQNSGRYNHMRNVHNIHPEEKSNVRCLEKGCSFTCSFKEKLQTHLSKEHGIQMDITVKTFKCVQDFIRWKDDFERQEKSRFVKKSGSRTRDEGVRVAYYYCNRSGTYVSHSKGIKGSKKKGTSKSNHHCTASITCIELPTGRVEIKVCSTHYGHDNELHHLRLTQSEKFMIAEQLVRGVPRDLVLDNVRASTGSDVDRIHLITIKDVKNIEKAYGIQSCNNEKTDNMFLNLSLWIGTIMQTDQNLVLYFNEEGIINTKSHDVTVMLLSIGQAEVLHKFGTDGIFYISTFAAKNRNVNYFPHLRPPCIYVTVLMLVDDMNGAVPVSYMVSNINDIKKINLFFQCLKQRLPDISAKAVLTDEKQALYDAWCSVFEDKPFHLWSNRCVDSDWRDNLICIADEEVQVSIYEKLYSYIESPDQNKLSTTLKDYVSELQNNVVTKKFGDYFANKYIGSEEVWAGCYGKKVVSVSAQLNMELVYNEIEELSQKKNWDRNFLVKIVQHLLKLFSEKQCERQKKLQRQVQELSKHHQLALTIQPEFVTWETDCWRVDSVKNPSDIFFIVNEQSNECESTKCMLYCVKCNVCAHQFRCTCKVYSYDHTMCKHIHAVAVNFIEPKSANDNSQSDSEKEIEHSDSVISESLWQKVKVNKKKQNEENEADVDILPIIKNMLLNGPTKKGRPRKSIKKVNSFNVDKSNSELCDENRKRKRKVRKKSNDTEQNNFVQEEDNVQPRRINILRKCRKFVK